MAKEQTLTAENLPSNEQSMAALLNGSVTIEATGFGSCRPGASPNEKGQYFNELSGQGWQKFVVLPHPLPAGPFRRVVFSAFPIKGGSSGFRTDTIVRIEYLDGRIYPANQG